METKANYVLIGAFTILVTLFLLGFGLWAAKYSSDKSWREYDVVFREPVTGLTNGSSVQYNGIAIGTIESLKLAPNDPRAVVARLKLQADAPIRTDTRAKLSMTSLTGPPIIQLTGGDPRSPRLLETPGNEVPIILTEPSALQNIADTTNRLVERLDRLLSDQNVERISATLDHIESLTGEVAAQRKDLATLITNAREASEWIRQNNISSICLVTADYHLPRAIMEFNNLMPDLQISPYAVKAQTWRLPFAFAEYNKTIWRWLNLRLLRGSLP